MNVYGYPIGGKEQSVTEGIVSRIEYSRMYYDVYGLRIQIDAALNAGNSGGPAISNKKIVGLFELVEGTWDSVRWAFSQEVLANSAYKKVVDSYSGIYLTDIPLPVDTPDFGNITIRAQAKNKADIESQVDNYSIIHDIINPVQDKVYEPNMHMNDVAVEIIKENEVEK